MGESVGFGGRTYSADGLEIRVEPLRHERENGSVGYSLGFPLATLSEAAADNDGIGESLAEYLSCPKRAAAPALYEALAYMLRYHETGGHEGDPDEAEAKANAALSLALGEKQGE